MAGAGSSARQAVNKRVRGCECGEAKTQEPGASTKFNFGLRSALAALPPIHALETRD